MRSLAIPERWQSRAIVIAEAEIPRSWFSPSELAAAETFRLQKRREEFLLSRAAAKTLAVHLGLTADPASCVIDRRLIGSRHVSLSHSAPYAAAAIDAAAVGVDVQVVREISENALHLFLSDTEANVLRSIDLEHRMIHFWCAKEALWKRYGGEIETLKRVPLFLQGAGPDGLRFSEVETVRSGDAVVALTLPIS